MCATLEEEHPVALRASTNIPDGYVVRIVAYLALDNTTLYHADYHIVTCELKPVAANGVLIPEGESYLFVAYAFNSATVPTHSGTSLSFTGSTYPNLDLL